MKKFYASLASVALSCAVLMAAPKVNHQSLQLSPMMYMEKASEGMQPKLANKNISSSFNHEVKPIGLASRADEDTPQLAGDYMVSYSDRNGTTYTGTSTLIQRKSNVIFHQFIWSDVEDFEGTLNYYEYEDEDEENNLAAWLVTIPGNGQVTFYNDGQNDYTLYFYGKDPESGNYYIYTGMDIEFMLVNDPEINVQFLVYPYEDCGIFYGYETEQGFYGGIIMEPELVPFNGEMSFNEYDFEDMTSYEEYTVPIFSYVTDIDMDGTSDCLVVYNFCGFPEPAIFQIDLESKLAIDLQSPLYYWTDDNNNEHEFVMIPLIEKDGELDIDEENPVSGNLIDNVGNASTLEIEDLFAVYSSTAGALALLGEISANLGIDLFGSAAEVDPLYAVGAFCDWDLAQAPEFTYNASTQIYTLSIDKEISDLKISSSVADWDAFNAAAVTPVAALENGVACDIVIGESQDNVVMPWTGVYEIQVNIAEKYMIVKTETQRPGSTDAEVYLRGGMNGWNVSDEWKFATTDGVVFNLDNVTIEAGVEFKVADANWSAVDFGGPTDMEPNKVYTLVAKGGNCTLAADFTGNVTFNFVDQTILFGNGAGITGIEADNAEAVYYNLQGVKVENPTSGSLYIVKKNGKASKVLVK